MDNAEVRTEIGMTTTRLDNGQVQLVLSTAENGMVLNWVMPRETAVGLVNGLLNALFIPMKVS